MKRAKRFTLRSIAIGLAIVAVLAPVAHAKPTPVKQQQPPIEISSINLGPGEIPYLSHGTLTLGPGEIPYVDDGTTAAPARHAPTATVDDDSDIAFGIVSSAVIAVLLALGLALMAIRQSRKTRLSPA
jgi:hypothetical protein